MTAPVLKMIRQVNQWSNEDSQGLPEFDTIWAASKFSYQIMQKNSMPPKPPRGPIESQKLWALRRCHNRNLGM